MAKRKDFEVGQTCWILRINNAARYRKNNEIEECIVKRVGRKYVYVSFLGTSREIKIDIKTMREGNDSFLSGHVLFLSKEEYEEAEKRKSLITELLSFFDYKKYIFPRHATTEELMQLVGTIKCIDQRRLKDD